MWLSKAEKERLDSRSEEGRKKRRTCFNVSVQDMKDVIASSKAAAGKEINIIPKDNTCKHEYHVTSSRYCRTSGIKSRYYKCSKCGDVKYKEITGRTWSDEE